jgi:hypothetical protein
MSYLGILEAGDWGVLTGPVYIQYEEDYPELAMTENITFSEENELNISFSRGRMR